MKLLLYCTKGKPLFRCSGWNFHNFFDEYVCARDYYNYFRDYETVDEEDLLNGKIVAECDFEVEEFDFNSFLSYKDDVEKYNTEVRKLNEICKKSCLSATEMVFYLDTKALGTKNPNGMIGYAIHIQNLHIFDKPKELSDYYSIHNIGGMLLTDKLKKAPQNMQRVSIQEWEFGTMRSNDIAILISIHPKWLCKILNGEKTIEIRKKILNNMIKEK